MALFGKKNANYISAKETKRISKENRKITNEIEKKRNRKNIPESEYITTMKNPENVVEFDNVHTYFFTDIGTVKAVDGVSFEIPQGKTVGVVGESGCGKSVTSLSLMQLVQRPQGQTVEGEIRFNTGDKVYNIVNTPTSEMQKLRGNELSMIFQEPMTALNPTLTIGTQLMEPIMLHQNCGKKEAWTRAVDVLKRVGIAAPEKRMKEYPHQLSGGMRQRVMIAMAVSCEPRLLIADEPTTALDVTIQAQILELMCELREKMGTAIMLITHDMGVVAETADDVLVLYAGKAVEYGSIEDIFERPKHPYTQGLLNSIPRLDEDVELLNTIEGTVPAPDAMPAGCRFAPRCPYGKDRCMKEKPGVYHAGNSLVSCFRYEGEK